MWPRNFVVKLTTYEIFGRTVLHCRELAPLIEQATELREWYGKFLAQTVDAPTPQGVEDFPELARMLAERRAVQAASGTTTPRKPRAPACASPPA